MNDFKQAKQKYEEIVIPTELQQVVNEAISKNPPHHNTGQQRKGKAASMKNRKWYQAVIGIAAGLLIIMMVGLNTSESFAMEAQNIPVLGAIAKILTIRSYEKTEDNTTVKVEIPAVEDTSPFITDVNAEINKKVTMHIAQAEKNVAEYKTAFLETGGTEEDWAKRTINITADYEIKCQTDNTVSFVITVVEDWNNAGLTQYFYNLDLISGTYLTLSDILGEDYQNIANESILAQIKTRMEENPDEQFFDGSSGIDGFAGIDENTKFYLDEGGNPVITFAKYEIAPGFMGIQEFTVIKP